jgi:hypothetical protein
MPLFGPKKRADQMKIKQSILVTICAASWTALGGPVSATDLNGAWATDVSVCSKVFVKKGEGISFAQDSDQYGGGFILEGNKARGQMQSCTIKARKEDGNVIHMIAACADDIMTSNVQFSAKVVDENTITRIFPGMPEFSISYSRCPN